LTSSCIRHQNPLAPRATSLLDADAACAWPFLRSFLFERDRLSFVQSIEIAVDGASVKEEFLADRRG
jgi:hypothetical protein